MIELRISEAAALSIVEQVEYYASTTDRSLAHRWDNAVSDAIQQLVKMPETGAHCRFPSQPLAGLRWAQIPGFPKHMIFYRYSRQERTLLIIHVLHGARDLEAILNESE